MKYEIYTDGACSKNPGPGGYAFIIISEKGEQLKVSGSSKQTTNNCMELKAICRALQHIKNYEYSGRECNEVIVYSDSAYCINALNEGWLYAWKANTWKTKAGKSVKNIELWIKIVEYLEETKAKISFVKVKGHAGNKYNELVDKMAKEAIKQVCK